MHWPGKVGFFLPLQEPHMEVGHNLEFVCFARRGFHGATLAIKCAHKTSL